MPSPPPNASPASATRWPGQRARADDPSHVAQARGEDRMLSEYGAKPALKRRACGAGKPRGRTGRGGRRRRRAGLPGRAQGRRAGSRPQDRSRRSRRQPEIGRGGRDGAGEDDCLASPSHRPARGSAKVLVERMVSGVVAELIVGVKRDPQFGLALVVGAGRHPGRDGAGFAMLLLPTDRAAIERAVSGPEDRQGAAGISRPSRRRHRGRGGCGAGGRELCRGPSRTNLLELDVNPLMVLAKGAVAVDALVVLAEELSAQRRLVCSRRIDLR